MMRPLKRPEMVLIDLDGTLVDSAPDLAWCVDAMNRELGLEPRGEPAVRTWVGNGVERLVKRALTNRMEDEPEPELFERALALFNTLYAEHTSGRSQVYPGVREGLIALQERVSALGCVTNKPAAFTQIILRDKQLDGFFTLVVAGDTLAHKKPHPEPLLHAARHYGLSPEDCLMVGDSKSDVAAARAAGFAVVCVSYGYNHGRDIREQNPDAVVDSLAEIPGLFATTGSGA